MITINYDELTSFAKNMLELVNDKYPAKSKKLMNKAGFALKRIIKKEYNAKTKKKTGNLLKGVTKGKPYKYHGNTWQIRVFNKAPHAHLLEYGHRFRTIKRRGWKFTGQYVPGRNIMGSAAESFYPVFNQMCEEFADEIIEDLAKGQLK